MVGVADAGKRDCDVELVGEFEAVWLTVIDMRVLDCVGVTCGDDVTVPVALVAAALGERVDVEDAEGVDVGVEAGVGVVVGVGAITPPQVLEGHKVQ